MRAYIERRRLQILAEMEEHKNRLMCEMTDVDKETLSRLRDMVDDYYNAKANLLLYVKDLEKDSVDALKKYQTELEDVNRKFLNDIDTVVFSKDITAKVSSLVNDEVASHIDNIVQELGDGTGTVMSQKAVTDNIVPLQNVVNKYTGVNNEVGKVLRLSDGQIVNFDTTTVTDYIPVESGSTILLNQHIGSGYYGHALYDSSKQRVSLIPSNADNMVIEIPDNVKFIRCTILTTKVGSFVICQKDQIRSIENYLNLCFKSQISGLFKKFNLFDKTKASIDGCIKENGYVQLDEGSNFYVSDYIPVTPNSILLISNGLGSAYYYNEYYDKHRNLISRVAHNQRGFYELEIPENVYYIRYTGTQKYLNEDFVMCISDTETIVPSLKVFSSHKTDVNSHYKAFSGGCMFGGREVYVTRVAPTHLTQTDVHGHLEFDTRDQDGKWLSSVLDTTNFPTLGELRDPNLVRTNFPNVAILSCFTTRVDEGGNNIYENVMYTIDKNLNITSSYVEDNATFHYWGNTVITPSGKLLKSAYHGGYIKIYRSKLAFNGSLEGVEFEEVATITDSNATESTLFYTNDRLVCFYRRDGVVSGMVSTTNLEGSGWGAVAHLDYRIEAPCSFTKYNSNKVVMTGSLNRATDYSDRVPAVFLLDCATNSILDIAEIDGGYSGWGGYTAMTNLGGDNLGVVYFKHGEITDFCYNKINLRYLLNMEV